jgi:hypothetical protein
VIKTSFMVVPALTVTQTFTEATAPLLPDNYFYDRRDT